MKKIFYLVLAVVTLSCTSTQTQDKNDRFRINRGLNLSHWLSQTDKRGAEREAYVTAADFKNIANMGFDHIRLPIDETQMWDEQGNRHEEAFKLLHFAIEQCKENNLRVIVDLHTLRSHHFNETEKMTLWYDTAAQQKYISFWKQLSAELNKYPNELLAYDPLNEAVADRAEEWNSLINWVVDEIRVLEPSRTIIMGSNRWQTVENFKYLRIPQGDTNIILSFHFYSPLAFTHYQSPWSEFKDLGLGTTYPGWAIDTVNNKITDERKVATIAKWTNYCTKNSLSYQINQAVEIAKTHNLQLYCGEFGCFPTSDLNSRLRWYEDVIDIFKKNDIAWSHWNYKNDFPIVDTVTLTPTALVPILLN